MNTNHEHKHTPCAANSSYNLSDNGFDLLDKMLCYDPKKRISATDALDHPYFDSLDKSRYAKIEAQFEKENRAMN